MMPRGPRFYMSPFRFGLSMAAFVGVIGGALYAVAVYPMQNIDYYKQRQAENRAGINIEAVQPAGMRVWSDPFAPIPKKSDS